MQETKSFASTKREVKSLYQITAEYLIEILPEECVDTLSNIARAKQLERRTIFRTITEQGASYSKIPKQGSTKIVLQYPVQEFLFVVVRKTPHRTVYTEYAKQAETQHDL